MMVEQTLWTERGREMQGRSRRLSWSADRWVSKLFLCWTLLIFLGWAGNLHSAENSLEKGISEFKAENYEEAVEFLKQARAQQPDSSLPAFYLGLTYKQMGLYEESVGELKEAIRLAPPIPGVYADLVEVLYHQNKFKEALAWIAKAEQEGSKPGRIFLLKGLIFHQEGRYQNALEAFKQAKEIDPSLAQEADLQMAMTYAQQRRFAEARESLKTVVTVNPTSELASFAQEYDKALTKGLEEHKPWQARVGLAYQYDDNVVLKPSSAIPGVLISGEKDSSVVTALRLDYAPILSDPWFFHGQFDFFADTYLHTHSHSLIVPTISLTPGYTFRQGAITLPVSYSYVWLGGDPYQGVALTKPTVSWMFSPDHVGLFSAGYARRESYQTPSDPNENREGNIFLLSAGYLHPFAQRAGIISVIYEFSRDITKGRNWDNRGSRINASILLPLMRRVKLTLSGEAFWQDYVHTHTSFGIERKDSTYSGSTGLILELLKGLDLNLQYLHTNAHSNIPVYEYKRNVYTAGIEYKF